MAADVALQGLQYCALLWCSCCAAAGACPEDVGPSTYAAEGPLWDGAEAAGLRKLAPGLRQTVSQEAADEQPQFGFKTVCRCGCSCCAAAGACVENGVQPAQDEPAQACTMSHTI